jgi:hypothetical protein
MKTQIKLYINPRDDNKFLVATYVNDDKGYGIEESNLRDVFVNNVTRYVSDGNVNLHLYTRKGVLPAMLAKHLSKVCYEAGSVLTFHAIS